MNSLLAFLLLCAAVAYGQELKTVYAADSFFTPSFPTGNWAFFDLVDVATGSYVQGTLRFFMFPDQLPQELTDVKLYSYNRNDLLNPEVIRRTTTPLGLTHGKFWFKADISQLTKHWLEYPHENFGILIKIISADGEIELRPNQIPQLEYKIYRDQDQVNDLGIVDCTSETINGTSCCRYKYVFDFEKAGWDNAAAPKRIPTYYCDLYPNDTNRVAKKSRPVCAPRLTKAQTMLMTVNREGNKELREASIAEMITTHCGWTQEVKNNPKF